MTRRVVLQERCLHNYIYKEAFFNRHAYSGTKLREELYDDEDDDDDEEEEEENATTTTE